MVAARRPAVDHARRACRRRAPFRHPGGQPGLTGIGADPPVAIGQRSLLVPRTRATCCGTRPGSSTPAAVAAVRAAGGLRFVTASHPHFYGRSASGRASSAPRSWSRWPTRPGCGRRPSSGPAVVGDIPRAARGDARAVRRAFSGSAVLHWADGADGRGVLLAGDTIFVTPGEDRCRSRSAPNRLPLSEAAVHAGLGRRAALRLRPDLRRLVGSGAAFGRLGDGAAFHERYMRPAPTCRAPLTRGPHRLARVQALAAVRRSSRRRPSALAR